MPAPTVRADYAELQRVAQKFRQEAESLGRMNRGLKERIEILQHGDWIGEGAEKFCAEMAGEVLPTLGRLQAAVEEADKVTRQIVLVMGGTEREAAGIFQAGIDYMITTAQALMQGDERQMLARLKQDHAEAMQSVQDMMAEIQKRQADGNSAAMEHATDKLEQGQEMILDGVDAAIDQVEETQAAATDAVEDIVDQVEEAVEDAQETAEEAAETVEDIMEAKNEVTDQIIKNLFG